MAKSLSISGKALLFGNVVGLPSEHIPKFKENRSVGCVQSGVLRVCGIVGISAIEVRSHVKYR